MLVGFFPTGKPNNPDIYIRGLAMLFAAYPKSWGEAVLDPVSGLPSRLRFMPSIADLKEALEAENPDYKPAWEGCLMTKGEWDAYCKRARE